MLNPNNSISLDVSIAVNGYAASDEDMLMLNGYVAEAKAESAVGASLIREQTYYPQSEQEIESLIALARAGAGLVYTVCNTYAASSPSP